MLQRRQFLQASLGAGAVFGLPRWLQASAVTPSEKARLLVLLELDGGNDALNTLVPYRDELYWSMRPDLVLEPRSLLTLDQSHALHPALPQLAKRFESGQLCCVEGVGYAPANLSHFRSKDVWQTAVARDPLPAAGWLGRARCAREVYDLAAGSERLPRAFAAAETRAIALTTLPDYRLRAAGTGSNQRQRLLAEGLLASLHEGEDDPRHAPLQRAYWAAVSSVHALAGVAERELATKFPNSNIGRDLETVARVIGAGIPVRCFHVAQSGYDTHTDQVRDHARLLADLDQALAAFTQELESQGRWSDVLILTISEFGRRPRQNGVASSAGSDHGAASVQMLLGGGVRGGFRGSPPDLAALDEHGNWIATVDFRQVYASVLKGWLGQDPAPILGAEYAALDLFSS